MRRVRHAGPGAAAFAVSVALGLAAAGCGQGSGGGSKREQRTPAASLETRALVDDPIVAEVNGAPVHASCVAAQLRPAPAGEAAATPQEGLQRCIDFELLAQAAAARGLTAEPEVAEAQKREAVRRFTEAEFAGKVVSWEDLPDDIKVAPLKRARALSNRPELREADYVWGPSVGFPPGSPEDRWAKGLADEVYAALKDRTGLTPAEFHQTAFDLARGRLLLHGNPKTLTADAPAQGFAKAMFALPEIGRIGPPVRIDDSRREKGDEQGGWYVLLLTRRREHVEQSDEALEAQLIPELRRRFFPRWAQAFYAGHTIEQHPDLLQALVAADQEQGTALPAAPPPPAQPQP
jgi:hypothetical protein